MLTIHHVKHEKLIIDVLTKVGIPSEQAKVTSEVMGYADQRGIDSHGILLLKTYVDRIREKIINNVPSLKWNLELGNIAVLDGDHGIGHYNGNMAMRRAVKMASKNTIGLVFVNNTTHYGASGFYTEMAAEHGMIGFSTTNTMPLMAPSGGSGRILGNNPISFSVPRDKNNPVILDIACSVVAAGKIILAEQEEENIPFGWAIDKYGHDTDDPYKGFQGGGSLIPIANHKGYGLSLIMDVIAGVLSGANYGTDVDHSNIGSVMMAINVDSIMSKRTFNERLNDLTSMVKDAEKINNAEDIYLPGEIEYLTQSDRLSDGIPLNKNLYNELEKLTIDLNIDLNNYL